MTAPLLPAVSLCLLTGSALGLLYLLLKAIRLSFSTGRFSTALLDILFGLTCGVVVFLTALAVDKGRLRFLQAASQLLAAWATLTALDPLATALGLALRKLALTLRRPFAYLLSKLPRRRKRRRASGKRKAGRRKVAGKSKKPKRRPNRQTRSPPAA